MDGSTPVPQSPFAALSRDELEAQITELAGHLNAATYRWLTLIAEFDRRFGWHDGALRSCAHWLNFKVGLNLGAAREKVRVAHALSGVPKIAAAMARGELSYSKVRALTRVATPATEDTLLMIAHHGTAHHVETTVRHFRRAQEALELSREARQQETRRVEYWYDTDGSLVLKARLPAVTGALLVKALDAALDAPLDETTTETADASQSFYARRADALAVVAESYLRHGSAAAGSSADVYQVVVHVDADTLKDQTAGRCHVDQGTSIPVETARRVSCDASLVRIVENDRGEALDVGRKTRTIPPSIRRALNARDQGCCFPGCTARRFVDAHHIEHWADGGETKLSNLLTLCRSHHRLVHEGGILVTRRADGGFNFVRPDGRLFAHVGDTPMHGDWPTLRDANLVYGMDIDADSAACRWTGGVMDYDLGVSVLCAQTQRAKNVSAETPVAGATDEPVNPWTLPVPPTDPPLYASRP